MSQKAVKAEGLNKKKGFKMPHLLFLMIFLLLFMSALTFVIPAGQFAKDPATGKLIGSQFNFVGKQTPVYPWEVFTLMLPGIINSGLVIGLLLASGGAIGVILDTGAIDDIINWSIYKLQNKGVNVLVPLLFIMMGVIGGFGGGDQMIAIVPIGVVFAKKLRLDPIVAAAVTFFASFIGFATGPTRLLIPQTMLGIEVYSGFLVRFVTMMVMVIIGALYTLRYAKKILKDPSKSLMGSDDWIDGLGEAEIKKHEFSWKSGLVTFIFFAQYAVIVYLMLVLKQGNEVMPAILIVASILCGIIYGMKLDDIGNSFAKGVAGMGFVGFIIGLAGTMNLIMTKGQILHTIVYYATIPLRNLNLGFAAIGISAVVTVINIFIPSASSKAAILIPIIQPITEALGMPAQVACSAFQFGDGYTNMITPTLGATTGSLEIAGVPFNKWVRWALPCLAVMTILSWILLYFLSIAKWVG